MRSLEFTILGIFGALGHWFFLSSAAFLYSLLLVTILVHELLKIFNRIVLMMNSAGVNSITDPLTGLYNKRFLMTKAEQLVAKQSISIIFADIDNFKELNDQKGHDMGDSVLKEVAKALKETVANHGFACRYGGEEIVSLITNGNPIEIAENFREKVEKIGTTVSVGVASGKKDTKWIINQADKNMYEAKNTGKNRVISNSEATL